MHGYTIPAGFTVIVPAYKESPCSQCEHFSLGKNTDVNGSLAQPCDDCQPLEDYRAFIEGRAPINVAAARAEEKTALRKLWPFHPAQGGGYVQKRPFKHTCPYCHEIFFSARKIRKCCDKVECAKEHRRQLGKARRMRVKDDKRKAQQSQQNFNSGSSPPSQVPGVRWWQL
jgi:hypothetical protein